MKVAVGIILIYATYAYEVPNILRLLDDRSLEDAIQRKCISNGQSPDHFSLAFNDTHDCLSSTFDSEVPDPIQNHKKFCRYLTKEKFYGCIKNFTTSMLPCLEETETYLQHFILNVVSSGYNEICGSEGLSNLIYLDDKFDRSGECLAYAVFWYIGRGIRLSELAFFKNLEKGIMNLNKKNICLDFRSLKRCVTRGIENVCKAERSRINNNNSRFTDLLFHPFLEQCKEFNERNSVLIE